MNFFRELVSKSEVNVDALTVASALGLVALVVFTGFQEWENPASFSGSTFAFGCASLLGAMGAGKGMRDALQPKDTDDGNPPKPLH